jgi:branched-chain amino acid transport system ATP-binding protein
MSPDIVVATRNLTKEFRGFVAVKDISLNVRRGTIHSLIGPNGAGKTTCFNLLTKFLAPDAGTILYNGRDITRMDPARVARLGLVRSFQISATFLHLSALENVRVALQRRSTSPYDFWRSERVLRELEAEARDLLEMVGLADFANVPATSLSYGRKRALELATTLALKPDVMLLDEPTAGMGHEDVDRIVDLVRRASFDRTILMVEHNLAVVASLSDTITVLAQGQLLAEGDYATVSRDQRVIEAYVGRGLHG